VLDALVARGLRPRRMSCHGQLLALVPLGLGSWDNRDEDRVYGLLPRVYQGLCKTSSGEVPEINPAQA